MKTKCFSKSFIFALFLIFAPASSFSQTLGHPSTVPATLIVQTGTVPSSSSCGTGPSFSGSPSSFKVTIGTGTVTACTINNAFSVAPQSCVLTAANSTASAQSTTGAYISAINSSNMTITGTALAGAAYYVHCF